MNIIEATKAARKVNPLIAVGVEQGRFLINEVTPRRGKTADVKTLHECESLEAAVRKLAAIAAGQ